MTVMSVDDSKTVRFIVSSAVKLLGYDFEEAANGKDALDKLQSLEKHIDLIILDWNMPVMDGITFLKTVKADDRYAHIPVMMLTTENEKMRILEAVENGAVNYLVKPFTQEQLVSKIMEAMGKGI